MWPEKSILFFSKKLVVFSLTTENLRQNIPTLILLFVVVKILKFATKKYIGKKEVLKKKILKKFRYFSSRKQGICN